MRRHIREFLVEILFPDGKKEIHRIKAASILEACSKAADRLGRRLYKSLSVEAPVAKAKTPP